jgi:two-component system, cell cycle sensor histidine kinase and response regulator CckA
LPVRVHLLATALIVALPAAAIIVFTSLQLRREELKDATSQVRRVADTIAAHQESLVAGAEQLVNALTQVPEVRRGEPGRVHALLAKILALNSQYSNIFVADPSGRVWAQGRAGPSFSIADRRYFQQALASGRLSSGEYVISRATGRPAVNFAIPFRDGASVVTGVICVGFNLEAVRRFVTDPSLPTGTNYLLLDHRGVVLARAFHDESFLGVPFPPEQFKAIMDGPDETSWIGPSMAGGDWLVAMRKLRLQGEATPHLYVLAGAPVAPIYAVANRILLRNVALLLLFLFVAAAFAWMLGERSIARPLRQLESATQRLANGDLQVRVSDTVGGREIGALARTFDEMARQLAEREKARLLSDQLYRQLFELESDALFLVDRQSGDILEVNPAAVRLFGYTREELLGMRSTDLSAEPEKTRASLASSRGRVIVERPHRRRDGHLFPVEVSSTYFTWDGREVVLAGLRDITQRTVAEAENRALLERLFESQKMESVGRLAGGIAHDFNNLLTVISGHGELLRQAVVDRPELLEDLDVIRQAGESAAALTRQLLAFSRKQLLQPRVLDLNALVDSTNRMLRRVIGENVRLVSRQATRLWRVRADPGQIEQVVMNLAVNARDAMPGGGCLTIETANVVLDASSAAVHKLSPGEHVLLSVSDTGVGMDAATRARVFEPFFTTKQEGKGTGLGLATVYGIVTQSGGQVEVESEPGRGTTFRIYLPQENTATPPVAAPGSASSS